MLIPENCFDNITDDEVLRRDFFSRYRDEEGNWGISAFKLRPTIKPPENYLSLARTKIAPDPILHANSLYATQKLKKLEGYVELRAGDIRAMDVKPLEINVYTEDSEDNAHAGLYTWKEKIGILDANADAPELMRLQHKLLCHSLPSYKEYTIAEKERWKAAK